MGVPTGGRAAHGETVRVIEAVELVGCHVLPTATISASPWRWCASVWPGCVSTHLAAASCVWRRQRLRLPTSTASPRRGSGRPPPPSCVRCADSWARSIGAAIAFGEACDRRFRVQEIVDVFAIARRFVCDRVGRLSNHTGQVVIVVLRRAQLARLGARSACFRRYSATSQSIAHLVDRRSTALGPVEWPNREKTIAPPESWVTRCRASSSVGPRLQSVEVQPPPNHTRLATTRPMSGGLRNSPWRRWRSKAPAVVGRGEHVFFVRSLHVGDPCDVVAGSGGRAHRAPLGDLGAAHHRHSGRLRGRWQKPDCGYDGGHSEVGRASLSISRRRSPGYSRRPALRGRRRRPCPAHCHGVRREYCRSRLSRIADRAGAMRRRSANAGSRAASSG